MKTINCYEDNYDLSDIISDVVFFISNLEKEYSDKIENNESLSDFDLFILQKLLFINKLVIEHEKVN